MQKWEAEATTAAGKNVPNGTNFVPALIEALGPVLVCSRDARLASEVPILLKSVVQSTDLKIGHSDGPSQARLGPSQL
jgi:hypothetical protein